MPRTSSPLEEKPPAGGRDWSVPDEIWEIPQRVAKRGRQLNLDQKELARKAGVAQGTISKLLCYKTLKRFPLATAFALEDALDAPGLLVGRGKSTELPAIIDEDGFERKAQKLSQPPGPKPPQGARKKRH